MYETKQIHYKIIFKLDGQSETIEYKSIGVLLRDQNTHISFETKDGVIDLIYDDNQVILKQGESVLNFLFDKETWNQYKLPYGDVSLKTQLIKFNANDDCIKMKYELYDQGGLISTAYLLITLLPYHYQEAI